MMRKAISRGRRKSFFHWLVHKQLQRFFAGIHVRGYKKIPQGENPILYYSNHIAPAWDFCIATHFVYTYLKQDPFVMTDEFTMLPFAEWGGAFSINQKDPLSVARAIKYSIEIIRTVPKCALWMFPQGMMKPVDQRPLGFQNGIQIIIRQIPNLTLVPVTFFYTFCNYVRLEAFVNFGIPFSVSSDCSPSEMIAALENHLTIDLDVLRTDIAAEKVAEFETVMIGDKDIQNTAFQLMRRPLPPLKSWRLWY